jgi:hypothetical protein
MTTVKRRTIIVEHSVNSRFRAGENRRYIFIDCRRQYIGPGHTLDRNPHHKTMI